MLAIELLKKRNNSSNLLGAVCAVTGKTTYDYVKIKKVFAEPPYNLLAAPGSLVVDAEIAGILKNGHLRWHSWIIDSSGFRNITKKEAREIMQNQSVKPPFGIYCAQDMRRQGGLLTKSNKSWERAIAGFWEVNADISTTMRYYPDLLIMNQQGVGRKNLLSLEPHYANFKKILHIDWLQFKEKYTPVYRTPEYQLAVWLLPTKKEAEGAK